MWPGIAFASNDKVMTEPLGKIMKLRSLSGFNIKELFMGQMISFFVAGSGIAAASLSDRGLDFPLLMSLFVYLGLCSYILRIKFPLKLPLWRYAFFALVDTEANFLYIYSFRYTSITSIMLLDCVSIPTAMVLSIIFLGARYSRQHYAGVLMCLVGVTTVVLNDIYSGDILEGHSVEGDFMALFGAFLFGCSNVMQENFVKNHSRTEFLGMAGLFGIIISGIQLTIFELYDVVTATFSMTAIGYVALYVVCILLMYIWASVFLQKGDSALFNLSILTSDAYGAVFAYFIEKETFTYVYFLSFALIMSGLIIYHGSPHSTISSNETASIENVASGSSPKQDNALDEVLTQSAPHTDEFRIRPNTDLL